MLHYPEGRALQAGIDRGLYYQGHAAGMLVKVGAAPENAMVLSGRLELSSSGWLLLDVPNALVRGVFQAMHEPGIELPPSGDGQLNAHCSVMTAKEVEAIGADKINERGKIFKYQIGPITKVRPSGWEEMAAVYMISVTSPELKKLRRSYGLSELPYGNHAFHISCAVKRKGVTQNGSISKAGQHGGSKAGETAARAVDDAGVRELAVDEGSLPDSVVPCVQELWGPGDHSLRKVAEELLGVLGGHGPATAWYLAGAEEERQRLRARQLCLGFARGAGTKYAAVEEGRVRGEDLELDGSCGGEGPDEGTYSKSPLSRLVVGGGGEYASSKEAAQRQILDARWQNTLLGGLGEGSWAARGNLDQTPSERYSAVTGFVAAGFAGAEKQGADSRRAYTNGLGVGRGAGRAGLEAACSPSSGVVRGSHTYARREPSATHHKVGGVRGQAVSACGTGSPAGHVETRAEQSARTRSASATTVAAASQVQPERRGAVVSRLGKEARCVGVFPVSPVASGLVGGRDAHYADRAGAEAARAGPDGLKAAAADVVDGCDAKWRSAHPGEYCPKCHAVHERDPYTATCNRCGHKHGESTRKSAGVLDILGPIAKLAGDQVGGIQTAAGRTMAVGKALWDCLPSRHSLPDLFRRPAPAPAPQVPVITAQATAMAKKAADGPYRDRAEIFAFSPDGKLYGGKWEQDKSFAVPGGGVDPGEDVPVAGAREFREETGLNAVNPRLLPVPPTINPWSEAHRAKLPPDRSHFVGSRSHYVAAELPDMTPVSGDLDQWKADARGLYSLQDALRIMRASKAPMSPSAYAGRLRALQYLLAEQRKATKRADVDVLQHWAPPVGDPYAAMDGFAEKFRGEPAQLALQNTVGGGLAGGVAGGLTGLLAGSAMRPPQTLRKGVHYGLIGAGAGAGLGAGGALGDAAASAVADPTARLLLQSGGRLAGMAAGGLGGHLLGRDDEPAEKKADVGQTLTNAARTAYHHMPRVRAFDSVVGTGVGAAAGLGVDAARTAYEDWTRPEGQELNWRQKRDRRDRRFNSVVAGAGLGFGAGNLVGDRARRWVANNMVPFNYSGGLEQVKPKSLDHFVRGAILDQPTHQQTMPAKYERIKATLGPDFEPQMGARYEMIRRQLGVHTPDAGKDWFAENPDGTLSMNQANPAAQGYMRKYLVQGAGGQPDARLFSDPGALLQRINASGEVETPALFGQALVGGQQVPHAADSQGNIHARVLDRHDVNLDPKDREFELGALTSGNILNREWRDAPSGANLSSYLNPNVPNPETGKPYTNWETWRTLAMRDFLDNVVTHKNPWFSQRMVFNRPQEAGKPWSLQPLDHNGMPQGEPIQP